MRQMTQKATNDLEKYETILTAFPQDLREFVPYVQKLNSIKSELAVLDNYRHVIESNHVLFK